MQRSLLTGEYPAINALDTSPRYIDCYDRAVAILTRRPDLIYDSWCVPTESPPAGTLRSKRENKLATYCHCLFGYATTNRQPANLNGRCNYGCLTLIRDFPSFKIAENELLTFAIKTDSRIPNDVNNITIDHLPIFAGWHRRLDIALDRKPLPMRVGG